MKNITPRRFTIALGLLAGGIFFLTSSFVAPNAQGEEPSKTAAAKLDKSSKVEEKAVRATTKKPKHPVIGDPHRIAGAKVFDKGSKEAVNLTEKKCTDGGGKVVCGSGPAYATWCSYGNGVYKFIHE